MEREKLKNRIFEVIKQRPIGSVATINQESRPRVRYMAIQPEEDLTLYTTSFASSRKIDQIKKNSNVHIAFGADQKNLNLPYVNLEGTAEVLTDIEIKKKCWHEMLKQFFAGPEDPNYVVVKISPKIIEYTSSGAHEPEVYTA